MTIQQLSGIDTVVSNEKYNAYGTVKNRIANAYNRLPLEIQKLQFNEMLQEKIDEEIEGIGRPRRKKRQEKKKAKQQKKTQKKQAKAKKKEARKERRKEDKGLRALRLFMPLMRRKLKKKGVKITDPKSIKEVSTKFKTFIMDKKPIRGFEDSEVIGVIPPGAGKAAGEAVEVSAGFIKKIIDFIKGAIKKIKDRKKKGGKLSKEEEQDIAEAEAVEKKVEGGAGGGMALPLLAAGAAALFLFKK